MSNWYKDTDDRLDSLESGGSGGVDDYGSLTNKPQINEIELVGNKSLSDIGIVAISNIELEELLK